MRTLTRHPAREPAGTTIEVRPLDFDDPTVWSRAAGATTLYNTYWVRFAHGSRPRECGRELAHALLAAKRAGVRSCARHDLHPPRLAVPVLWGKAMERALAETGSPIVVRPSVLFDDDGVLLNNIAWLLRRLPVFAIGGRGAYRSTHPRRRPCAPVPGRGGRDTAPDAVGPERPTFTELAVHPRRVGSRARLIHVPRHRPPVGPSPRARPARRAADRRRVPSMAAGLADSDGRRPARPPFRRGWRARPVGRRYENELGRHFDVTAAMP